MKTPNFAVLIALILSLALSLSTPTFADQKPHYGIKNFWEVEPGLYRGAQPTKQGYETLKKLGVKTIVNFRKDRSVKKERVWAEKEGVRFISLPWRSRDHYSPQLLYAFLEIAGNPKDRPLFVHCKAGRDRTGLMMAAYRMYHDGWSESQAYSEMKRLGYHRSRYPQLKQDIHRIALDLHKDSKGSLAGFLYSHNPVFILRNWGIKLWNGIVSIAPVSS